jgi:pilus assembly protein CpaB
MSIRGFVMRIVFAAILLLGLALAGFAVQMARTYIGQTQAALAAERAARVEAVPTVDLYVMERPLAYGQALASEDVRVMRWPGDAVPEGAFVLAEGAPDPLFPEGAAGPRMVLRAMERHEPVLAAKLTEPGEDAGLTARLGPGKRAFAIRVDVASGVSGFVRPGDTVDVYWTGRRLEEEVTRLVEARVPVIAVDQTIDAGALEASVARTVTVEATPLQVASLAQAQATGSLTLSLVGVGDDSVAEAVEVDQRRLLGLVAPEPVAVAPAPEPARVCTVRTRRGAEVSEIPVACPS